MSAQNRQADRSSYDFGSDTALAYPAPNPYDFYRIPPQDYGVAPHFPATQRIDHSLSLMTANANPASTTSEAVDVAVPHFGHHRASSNNKRMSGIVSKRHLTPLKVTSRKSDGTLPAPKNNSKSGKKSKLVGRHDPVNHEIFKLVTDGDLGWQEVADLFNARVPPPESEWTLAGVYNRFTRNAPLIAKDRGVSNFNVQDYMYRLPDEDGKMHKRQRRVVRQPPPARSINLPESAIDMGEGEDELALSQAYQEVVAHTDLWPRVAKRFAESTGRILSPEECERRMTFG